MNPETTIKRTLHLWVWKKKNSINKENDYVSGIFNSGLLLRLKIKDRKF